MKRRERGSSGQKSISPKSTESAKENRGREINMGDSLKWKQKDKNKKIENRNRNRKQKDRKTEIKKQKQKTEIEKQKANPVELSSYQAIRLDQVKMKQLAYNRDMKVGKNSVQEKYKEQTQND